MLGLLGVLGISAPAANAATTVTCGSTIDTGGTYALAGNCSGAGITITASDVTLNLNGFTMTGPGESTGVYVDGTHSLLSGVSIVGPGKITRYNNGVSVQGYEFTDPATFVRDTRVTELTLTRNLGYGIHLLLTSGSTVSGNTAKGNMYGIALSRGIGDTASGNTANGNRDAGLGVDSESTGQTVRGNTANGNGFTGIAVAYGSTDNTISSNTAQKNGEYDLVDINDACDHNVWTGNRFKTANQACIN